MNEYRPPRFNKFSKKQPNCLLYLGIVNNNIIDLQNPAFLDLNNYYCNNICSLLPLSQYCTAPKMIPNPEMIPKLTPK